MCQRHRPLPGWIILPMVFELTRTAPLLANGSIWLPG
jgi:hypothetical protein